MPVKHNRNHSRVATDPALSPLVELLHLHFLGMLDQLVLELLVLDQTLLLGQLLSFNV